MRGVALGFQLAPMVADDRPQVRLPTTFPGALTVAVVIEVLREAESENEASAGDVLPALPRIAVRVRASVSAVRRMAVMRGPPPSWGARWRGAASRRRGPGRRRRERWRLRECGARGSRARSRG